MSDEDDSEDSEDSKSDSEMTADMK